MTAEFKPNDIVRAEVGALRSFGHTHDEIAAYLDIDEKTLVKHFKKELRTSIIRANAAVARRLFQKATIDGDVTCMIFWLKTRARWREVDRNEYPEDTKMLAAAIKRKQELDAKNRKAY